MSENQIRDCREAIELKSDGQDSGTFTGYASLFRKKDLENEVVAPGAFKRTLELNKGRFPLLWQHDKGEVIGSIVESEEDERGLYIKGRLSLGVQRARDVYALMRDGVIRGMSIGFRTIQDGWEGGSRLIKEIRLHEVSIVTFAAQPLALVTTVKEVKPSASSDDPFAWLSSLGRSEEEESPFDWNFKDLATRERERKADALQFIRDCFRVDGS